MVIVHLNAALGNQINQYGVARLIAHRLNTELKLLPDWLPDTKYAKVTTSYRLGDFNIQENFATPEEINQVRAKGIILDSREKFQKLIPNLKDFKSDVFVEGATHWMHDPRLYGEIVDIIQKEFTRKTPWNKNSAMWRDKIISAECPVSMHFRLGDYLYHPDCRAAKKTWAPILPLDYYYTCLDILKQKYDNLTVFVFSNNLQWCKENVRLDVPTEFVEGCETDNEEFTLLTLCKHNISSRGTFGECSAFINSNPDKKVFYCRPSNNEQVQQWRNSLTPEKKISLLDSGERFIPNNHLGTYIIVPFDLNNQPTISQRPFFSILLVVNNDAETISETLDSIFNQNYEYYEVVVIDNASTDGSGKICQQAIAGRENVIFKKLWTKVKNAEAWNTALKMTRGGGYYVLFLKGNDKFLLNAFPAMYAMNAFILADIVHLVTLLKKNEAGVTKYSPQYDTRFQDDSRRTILSKNGQEAVKFLLNRQINRFLGTKVYNRAFLLDKGIRFDEHLSDDEAELFFQMECFLKSNHFMYSSEFAYIAPKNLLDRYSSNQSSVNDNSIATKQTRNDNINAQIVSGFSRYFTALVDVYLYPKVAGGDFQILCISDNRANAFKATWVKEGDFGYQIQSYSGKLEFIVKATVSGKIHLALLGIWVRSPEDSSKFMPYWIDYTTLRVNGERIIAKLTPAWCGKPYQHYMDVKAGDEIRVQVEWLPHMGDT